MRKGDIVRLTLLDHARKDELLHIIAYGEIKEITDEKVTLIMWKVLDDEFNNNNEEMSIVRSCIIKTEILTEKDFF